MAWVSVHDGVVDHPKTRKFAALMKCTRHEAIGILVSLWQWGLHNADRDGVIQSATEDDIADGIMYRLSTGQSDGQSHGNPPVTNTKPNHNQTTIKSHPLTPASGEDAPQAREVSAIEQRFNEFWEAYPKKRRSKLHLEHGKKRNHQQNFTSAYSKRSKRRSVLINGYATMGGMSPIPLHG